MADDDDNGGDNLVEIIDAPDDLPAALTLQGQVENTNFLALLVFCLAGAIVFMINVYTNSEIVDVEIQHGSGITVTSFLIIAILAALLTAYMVYKPYMIDRANGGNIVLYALILYVVAQIFWSLTLFHSRLNRGIPELAGILFLAATVWLGWVCYNLAPDSVYIFLLLLAWCFYLIIYTYNVDSHPWKPIE